MKESKKEINQKIRDYLIKNPGYLTGNYNDVATKFKVSYERIRHLVRSIKPTLLPDGIVKKEPTFSVTDEVLVRKENAQIKSLKKQLDQAIKSYEEVSDMYDVALALKTQEFDRKVPKIEIDPRSKGEATVVVQVSDGHFGKLIEKGTVNNLNQYTPKIARTRMEKLAENTLKMITKERHAIDLNNIVIVLGGDFLENSLLHEHSPITTAYTPMEETLFARELLSKYIKTIADYGKFKKILIPCVRGNHPRQTKKMSSSTDYRLNYESLLYNILKQDFSDERFEWIIPESGIAEFNIYGTHQRAFHCHEVRYQGGIGGLTVPLNKYILRLDQITPAAYNYIHHYHMYSHPTLNCTLNGAVCGYDSYALQLGCAYQRPVQSFQLWDRERGSTVQSRIFTD